MTSVESKAETWKGTEELAQGVAESTVELLELLSHVQGGRMEEQRCLFDPKKTPCTPKHTDATNPAPGTVARPQVVSHSDQDGQRKTTAENETDRLCSMVSRVQGSRMDEQRCSAPQIFLAPAFPPPTRKAHSRPASPTATPASQRPPGSASLSPAPDEERVQKDGLHAAQQGVAPGTVEQEQFFIMLSHLQRPRMEEQRCVFDPDKRSACTPKHTNTTTSVPVQYSMADIDELFSILSSTQSHRLDDQRVSLGLLPGLQGVSVDGKETETLYNMVSRLQGCRIEEQRCSLPVSLSPGSPRSACMSMVPHESTLHGQDQLLSTPNPAPPRKARSNPSSPSRATPRKSRSRPKSPNRATPRKSRSRPNSPSRATPRKSRSRPNSPSRATPKKSRSRPPSPNTVQHVSGPISPNDDCFSLIHRVHTAQLHRGEGDAGAAHAREGGKPERGGEKKGGGEGGKREGKKGVVQKGEGRGKEEVIKEKKGGGKKK